MERTGTRVRLAVAPAILLALCSCGDSGYPKDWPDPAHAWIFSRRGGCPDLVATFTGVRSELTWLLGGNPDFEKPLPSWLDHRATITQADDGSWLKIQMTLSAAGLNEYRERSIRYNLQSDGRQERVFVSLRAGENYECRGGWLYNLHFPQETKAHGWQRRSLRIGRDRSGGLIAAATIREDSSMGWGDSPRVFLGSYDKTHWHRWPREDATAIAAIASAQSVTLHRYRWTNQLGTSVPIRFANFYLEPICYRVVVAADDGDETLLPLASSTARSRDARSQSRTTCPAGWGTLGTGEAGRTNLEIPTETHARRYRVEWTESAVNEGAANVIQIADARDLPVMP